MSNRYLHIGVIPDGGRRWARRTGVPLEDAYHLSFRKLSTVLARLHSAGCAEASIYCLSKANLGRLPKEVAAVLRAFETLAESIDVLRMKGICGEVSFIGNTDFLAESLNILISASAVSLEKPDALRTNLLIGYDAWDEINMARNHLGSLTMEDLMVTRPVDAIIRTGGGVLMSGFLPLQSQYAHLIVSDMLFNDLSDEDIANLVERATSVQHRHGL